MTVEAIKEAILALPEDDRALLEEWLSDEWDRQMESDFKPGQRGTPMIERVDAEITAGEFQPMKLRR